MNSQPYPKKLTIKSWAESDRPREKLMQTGRNSLSDAELLAILLGSGSKNQSAVELAQSILFEYQHSLSALGKASVADLKKFKGVGEAKAITIIAALDIGRRRKEETPPERAKIVSSKSAYQQLYAELSDLATEAFMVLMLNQNNKVLQKTMISTGGISGTVVDTRIVFKKAIELGATSMILAHNHPSGNTTPSEADKQLTKKMVEAGKFMQISVLDHLIIGDETYFSFADEGLI